jgi:predicted dehydrogenase
MRFGLVGTGFWADVTHARGISEHPDATLVGVWGRDAAKAHALAARHGAAGFADLDELIDVVDAVAFAVPPDVQARLALRAAERGKALLLDKPLALTVTGAERIVAAVRAPTAVLFTSRFDPSVAEWYRDEVDGRPWEGGSVHILAAVLQGDSPFAASAWRHEHGGLWDAAPHALSALIPTLGPVTRIEAVRGVRDTVNLLLGHATGAASSVTVSLTAATPLFDTVFWGPAGVVHPPQDIDAIAAYGAAIDALREGRTQFDARFGLDVVRVLAAAESRLVAPPTE